jgi:hypothetical protein
VPIFKTNGIKLVVRLNKSHYDRRPFLAAGIRHVDLYYPDGSTPSDAVLQEFLSVGAGSLKSPRKPHCPRTHTHCRAPARAAARVPARGAWGLVAVPGVRWCAGVWPPLPAAALGAHGCSALSTCLWWLSPPPR